MTDNFWSSLDVEKVEFVPKNISALQTKFDLLLQQYIQSSFHHTTDIDREIVACEYIANELWQKRIMLYINYEKNGCVFCFTGLEVDQEVDHACERSYISPPSLLEFILIEAHAMPTSIMRDFDDMCRKYNDILKKRFF